MYRCFDLAHWKNPQAMVVISKDDSGILVETTIYEAIPQADYRLEVHPGPVMEDELKGLTN